MVSITLGSMRREGKISVLIVDNDDRVLVRVQELLETAGFNTMSTWSGHEALSLKNLDILDLRLDSWEYGAVLKDGPSRH
jgi:DNA-binding response OmpR family regulator